MLCSVGNNTGYEEFLRLGGVTTVALFGVYDAQLVCLAHSLGRRVVLQGAFDGKDLLNATLRAAFVHQSVAQAKAG